MEPTVPVVSSAFPRVRDLLRASWNTYKARISTFFPLTVLAFVISLITPMVHGPWLVTIFLIFSTIVFTIIEIALYKNLSYENNIGFVQTITEALQYFPKYVWTFIVLSLIILGGFVLLIVPAFVWMVTLGFAIPILVVEHKWGMEALVQSRTYVYGRGWRVANSFLWLSLALGCLSIVSRIILHFVPPNGVLTTAIQFLPIFLSLPISAAYTFNLYKYLKESNPNTELRGKKILTTAAILGVLASVAIMVGSLFFIYKFAPLIQQKITEAQEIKDHPYIITPADYAGINGGEELANYIISNLNHGISKDTTRKLLVERGWPPENVDRVLSAVKRQ
jgi:hypothetical protein